MTKLLAIPTIRKAEYKKPKLVEYWIARGDNGDYENSFRTEKEAAPNAEKYYCTKSEYVKFFV
jgi:hypothetical protein